MIATSVASEILDELRASGKDGFALRQAAVTALSRLPGYDWSGIYRLEVGELVLDSYVGEPTEHVKIPVGVGVCGTAVQADENQLVEDVRELDNYLACSLKTRSEIVVLIRSGGRILGQIDIDGHEVAAFGVEDEQFLEELASILAAHW